MESVVPQLLLSLNDGLCVQRGYEVAMGGSGRIEGYGKSRFSGCPTKYSDVQHSVNGILWKAVSSVHIHPTDQIALLGVFVARRTQPSIDMCTWCYSSLVRVHDFEMDSKHNALTIYRSPTLPGGPFQGQSGERNDPTDPWLERCVVLRCWLNASGHAR